MGDWSLAALPAGGWVVLAVLAGLLIVGFVLRRLKVVFLLGVLAAIVVALYLARSRGLLHW